jgi:SHS2 domain-containing protein
MTAEEASTGTWELVDHTADLGLRLRAPTLEALLAAAGRGLFEVITGDLAQVRPVVQETFEVAGEDPEYLLVDWLDELLYRFATRRMLFVAFEVDAVQDGVRARARGEPFDPERHRLAREVKAITYHGLEVRRTDEGWLGNVIVDI